MTVVVVALQTWRCWIRLTTMFLFLLNFWVTAINEIRSLDIGEIAVWIYNLRPLIKHPLLLLLQLAFEIWFFDTKVSYVFKQYYELRTAFAKALWHSSDSNMILFIIELLLAKSFCKNRSQSKFLHLTYFYLYFLHII